MSDYTPTTNEVRADYVRDHTRNFDSYMAGRSVASEQEHYGDRFDRWLAEHDADLRAEWEAEQGTEEPEWEYGWFCEWDDGSGISRLLMGAEMWGPKGRVFQMRRRTKAPGPWVPLEQEGESDAS